VGDHETVQPTTEVSGVNVPAPRAPRDDALAGPLADALVDAEPAGSGSGGLALAGILVLSGGWFGVSWRVLGSPVVDAVGEAAGGVVAVLVLVSVVGAVRHSRRGPPHP
jgi:hypothetical protein